MTFDTVIYAEDEKAAKQKVKYGTGEIDDMPVSVLAMPIESSDGLPAGWNAGCLPWGDAPENTTIGEILNANVEVHTSATGGAASTQVEVCRHPPNPTRNG